MIQTKNFVSGEIATVMDVAEIKAGKMIVDDDCHQVYRELVVRDKDGNHITLELYAKDTKKLCVIDLEIQVTCPLCHKQIGRNEYGICDDCRDKLEKEYDAK